ncbi:hypothetical protein [Streptomyces sp. NPDC058279]|uniref:hypothetical protein n=1 Tax=Streptomyces sp. NPDC058279 TaxID=3346418 RepID=UPI0036E3CEA6
MCTLHEPFRFRYLHAGRDLAADLRVDAYETVVPPPPTTFLIHRSPYLRLPTDRTPCCWRWHGLPSGASLHAE